MTKKQKRTIENVIADLNDLKGNDDNESVHYSADALLLEALEIVGAKDVVYAYYDLKEQIGFWYA